MMKTQQTLTLTTKTDPRGNKVTVSWTLTVETWHDVHNKNVL